MKGKSLPAYSGREWATSWTANGGRNRINTGILNLPIPSANDLIGGRVSEKWSGKLLVLRMEN